MKNSGGSKRKSDFMELPVEEARKRRQEVLDHYSAQKESPLVGIFWCHGNMILGDFCKLSEAELYGNILGSRSGHYDFWPEIQRIHHELACEEYEYTPRGRLLFDLATKQFVLISSKAIAGNKIAVKAICSQCNILADQDVILKTDLHYENPQELIWED